ncbi:MAG: FliA/WhiG family RNA polymerase sigma factor [Nitriliruptoraceae bacterium]
MRDLPGTDTHEARGAGSELGGRPSPPAGGASADSTSIDPVWEQFLWGRDRDAREQLILRYAPIVKYVAGRVAASTPADIELADLVSFGVIGLIDAIERYDPTAGAAFETYAIVRIRGAILDELRAVDWVPRRVRERSREIETALRALEAQLHRAPTDEELADELDEALQDAAATTIGVLDIDDVGDRPTIAETLWDLSADAPDLLVEKRELRQRLRAALRSLPDREQTVLLLYYFEGFTLGQICAVIGVSESRVSQIHAKAVMHLRTKLS